MHLYSDGWIACPAATKIYFRPATPESLGGSSSAVAVTQTGLNKHFGPQPRACLLCCFPPIAESARLRWLEFPPCLSVSVAWTRLFHCRAFCAVFAVRSSSASLWIPAKALYAGCAAGPRRHL